MKRHIIGFSITAILGLSLLLLPGCQETRWDLAEDYDFSAIDPVVSGLTGPSEFAASGLAAARYKVNARTGSTYAWTVTGANVDASTVVDGYPGWVDVLYSQSSVDVDGVTVSVVETTSGGKTSEAVSMTTDLKAFCPMTVNDFVGTWAGTEGGDGAGDITVTFEKGAGADEILVPATDGIPAFLSNIFIGWGETFQPGFGNEGDIILHINELNGAITIDLDYWGQTLPGPWDYWTVGSGSWSGCGDAPTISMTFGLDWDETGTAQYESTISLTKQ